MYLGAGLFLLLLVLLAYRLFRRFAGLPSRISLLPLSVLAILFTLFAVTNVVSWNDKVLFKIPLPDLLLKLGDIYRASSRFFWPCYYLILLFTIIGIARMKVTQWIAPALLGLAVCIQCLDCWSLLNARHFVYGAYTPPLDPRWSRLIEATDKVVLYPPFQASYVTDHDYQDFSFLAAKAAKPITTGYVARVDNKATATYTDSLVDDLQNTRVSRSLYVTTPANLTPFALALAEKKLQMSMLDGYCYLYAPDSLKNPAIDALSEELNRSGGNTLDSLRKTVLPNEFADITAEGRAGRLKEGKLTCYIERMKKGRNYLALSGWGVIENSQTNKGDSIYTILLSDKKTYIGNTRIEKRPDITARFKVAYMDDAGFKSVISTKGVDTGQYKIAIGITDGAGKTIYQVTDSVLRVPDTPAAY
jgi:hypothetical protein